LSALIKAGRAATRPLGGIVSTGTSATVTPQIARITV
jgi:hypothetical protein